MATTLPTLTPVEDTLFLTLCCRALDNRSPHPVLGDEIADEIVRTLDYDHERLNTNTNLVLNVALRAKKIDEVASRFTARHPDAVGLDLGAGFDTRAARIAVPPTVEWHDVDLPEVVAARELAVPERAKAHTIAADVRDQDWLDALPRDRPAVITADGLMGFLTEDELVSLLRRLVDHFPSGELVFNGYTRFTIWVARHSRGTKSVAGQVRFPGMDDPRRPERWDPRLHLVQEVLLSRQPEIARFPPVLRAYYWLSARSTSWSRKGTLVLHYRF
ncbi:O-methyltransferase involved in polyketide biosynthesis [Geodermatophilus bullaregiensis]|uniref:class I SAM-dependent methyltransferase n=1 Tax=Geodermatophilus bullaregiensis TaxID=1564160 RepID=UPI00195A53A2|nr:class I SAM-dependent methyltransferase [Geodermatophilus bullaregiensis]MBM7808972.1 O-methyltransferase involved in polyketide biosynthesis [Geodermatophilus bullaregiensis]